MDDDRRAPEAEDDRSAAVFAADDTGMIAGERLITAVDLNEELASDS